MEAKDLIIGRHYTLKLTDALLEVVYAGALISPFKSADLVHSFLDVKTTEQYLRYSMEISSSIFDIPVATGTKYDAGKLRYDLMVWPFVAGVTEVLTLGAKKYKDNNWKHVKGRRWRYFGALMRHLLAWVAGEKLDKETSLSHLYHAGCCLAFLSWCDDNPSPEDMEGTEE